MSSHCDLEYLENTDIWKITKDLLILHENYRDFDCKAEVLSQDFKQPVQDCKELQVPWP